MLTENVFRILLVEPEAVLAEITQFRLELLGYRVELASSGEEALTLISRSPPDVVVCDLTLPSMSGLEFIEKLASNEESSQIPIMALSIEADIETVQKAHQTGVIDYLLAPYQPLVLEDKIAKLVQRVSKAPQAAVVAKAV